MELLVWNKMFEFEYSPQYRYHWIPTLTPIYFIGNGGIFRTLGILLLIHLHDTSIY